MGLLTLEHSRLAYRADFALYGAAVALLSGYLLAATPAGQGPLMGAVVLLGVLSWSLTEYALHRFVLHGLQPFSRWHAEHHQRPTALICTPTVLSAGLILLLVFVPAWLLAGRWPALALTLGMLIGYLVYATTHHAVHHWRGNSAWLQRRRRWHAQHHQRLQPGQLPVSFGVTVATWDVLLRTSARSTPAASSASAALAQSNPPANPPANPTTNLTTNPAPSHAAALFTAARG